MCLKRTSNEEQRTTEQIYKHYEIEKKLANKLRNANKKERKKLYSSLYDELYQKILDHPQLIRKADPEAQNRAITRQMELLFNFIDCESRFLELGPGDCQLSFEVAKHVKKVFAIDVSEEITKNLQQPGNYELILSDGSSVDVPSESINLAYSNQLMEHLHPEDAIEQLKGIYKALIQNGMYICITPHKFTGPHDISRHFDEISTGFHLKEYTNKELYYLFKFAGFSKIKCIISVKNIHVKFPILLVMLVESFLELFPYHLRKKISKFPLFEILLGIRIIAIK